MVQASFPLLYLLASYMLHIHLCFLLSTDANYQKLFFNCSLNSTYHNLKVFTYTFFVLRTKKGSYIQMRTLLTYRYTLLSPKSLSLPITFFNYCELGFFMSLWIRSRKRNQTIRTLFSNSSQYDPFWAHSVSFAGRKFASWFTYWTFVFLSPHSYFHTHIQPVLIFHYVL